MNLSKIFTMKSTAKIGLSLATMLLSASTSIAQDAMGSEPKEL